MGHFSRYFTPGAKRLGLKNTVEVEGGGALQPGDVKNGQALLFGPCDGTDVQKWTLDTTGYMSVRGTDEAESSDGYGKGGECMNMVNGGWTPGKMQTWACDDPTMFEKQPTTTDTWTVISVPGGSQIVDGASQKCITAVQTDGGAVGLDRGLTIVAAQLKECLIKGSPSQTFTLSNYDGQGFPGNFPVKTLSTAPGGGDLCLSPQIVRMPHFDAVAFQAPSGDVALVAMNTGDKDVEFTLVDKQSKTGVRAIVLPPHAIHTYRWNPSDKSAGAVGANIKLTEAAHLPIDTKAASITNLLATSSSAAQAASPPLASPPLASPLLLASGLVVVLSAGLAWSLRQRRLGAFSASEAVEAEEEAGSLSGSGSAWPFASVNFASVSYEAYSEGGEAEGEIYSQEGYPKGYAAPRL